jgi:hypothetical protein
LRDLLRSRRPIPNDAREKVRQREETMLDPKGAVAEAPTVRVDRAGRGPNDAGLVIDRASCRGTRTRVIIELLEINTV